MRRAAALSARALRWWPGLLGMLGLLLLPALGCQPGPREGTPGLEPPDLLGDAGSPRQSDSESKGGEDVPAGATQTPPTGGPGVGNSGAGGAAGTPAENDAPGPPPASEPDAGLTGDLDAGVEPDGGSTDDPLFVGMWVVDQPTHAQYEATLYELQAGGALVARDTLVLGAPPYAGYTTGTVVQSASGTRCSFDRDWQSEDGRRLRLHSACNDGVARSVVLAFPEGDESAGLVPSVETVGGESGWDHVDFPWMWRKCPSAAPCTPF